ncbi:hypothetical protein JI739_22885 [Ramlibacter sp. AW1]|uniref:Uncharacterized protein n=1 Tax=Ramlibacter aurantiacus TaxID=2801330 RepID=A0A937D5Z0_9BURK|nr:hypothetical protein [Ramlibacter aurantiacus]MBL0423200.1 hypothetical protein [Ramlibacter aurantiacus]
MKILLAALVVAGAPALAIGQSDPASKPAKPAATKASDPKPAAKPRQPLARSAQKAVEEATPLDDDFDPKLSDTLLEVARQVYVGVMKCELGASVTVTPMRRPGMFMVATNKGQRFRMHPVESRTGAIRLEDTRRGALWIQLGNKSMLMSQRQGQRLADECQSPEQVTTAEYLKRNPMPSLLEPMPHRHGHGHGQMMHGDPAAAPAAPADAPAPAPAEATLPAAPPAAEAPAATPQN